jgi:fibrillarin-like rRNA methylase
MKSFKEFLSESVNISGDFNGNLYINSSEPEVTKESFVADVVWEGKIYRMEVEGRMMNKNELAEHLQGEYPGAIVHNIYPASQQASRIKNVQRYQPERLTWGE